MLPFTAQHYPTDEERRLYLGYSYGGLLGTEILLSTPQMFSGYILGSPSYWYGAHVMAQREAAYATTHTDLPAQVYLDVGEYEQVRYHKNYDTVVRLAWRRGQFARQWGNACISQALLIRSLWRQLQRLRAT